MSQDQSLINLIEKAGNAVGSEYKLAKAMGIPQAHISNWKSGLRNCTPADRARLAGFAQEDAVQELVRATINSAKGLKHEQLMAVLGRSLRATGATSVTALLLVASLGSLIEQSGGYFIRCIERLSFRQHRTC